MPVMLPSHLYVAVRDMDSSGIPARAGAPRLPAAWWDDQAQRVGPWWAWRIPSGPHQGEIVCAARVNALGGRALYAIAGPLGWLEGQAAGTDAVMPGREAWRRRSETGPRQIVRAWRWWRGDYTERATQADVDSGRATSVGDPVQRDGAVRRLLSVGHMLPDPTSEAMPWDLDADGELTTMGAAVIRVRALTRPCLPPNVPTIAGVDLHTILEQEPDRGA